MRATAFALVISGATTGILAQAPAQSPAAGPTFDVVSIKRHVTQPGAPFNITNNQRPDGGFIMTNVPAAILISRAYPPAVAAEMIGLPGWAMSEMYDVSATSSLTAATPDDRAAMLRAMLADRFKLVAHVEPRQQPVFDLVLAREDGKLGAGLTKIDADCAAVSAALAAEVARTGGPPTPRQIPDFKLPPPPCFLRMVDATMRDRPGDGQGRLGTLMEGETTIADLARALRLSAGRPVVDKTGLPAATACE